ncbi:IS200/IS605 family transposase [Saccharicrinis sp. FJH2]|uniref:IS200/IS605 family transposase n=1 Tax=unclassified Saccharicrinis TaxID=2646859 RepID=UPI0035D430CD
MSQSLSQIYVHLTFGTKERHPYIKDQVKHRLHQFIGGILRSQESPSVIINSVPDHIHILFKLSKNYALTDVIKEVKARSSKWLKDFGGDYSTFTWQRGYGAFSVNYMNLEKVINYIKDQESHHKYKSFREEVEEFVKQFNIINYDPEYFWN